MHGSPWSYDTAIPLLFAGPSVMRGIYTSGGRQQDVAPTLAAVLGVRMPPTASGRILPILRPNAARPRAVILIVLDGMRRDYFERYRADLPAMTEHRQRGAWFPQARVDYLPTNTAVGHSTVSTGADPRVHGVTGNNLFDRVHRERRNSFEGYDPSELMAPTLSDVWQLETRGRAIILAQGSSVPAVTALAGRGACQINGVRLALGGYDLVGGDWTTNVECFRLPNRLRTMSARSLWPADGAWMGHKIDSPAAVRRSGLFPKFEADAMVAAIEDEPIGADEVPDLILLNFKGADFVGHKHGPGSKELRVTLAEMDRHFSRIIGALEAKVGSDYLLAITGDHGMPDEPADPARRHFGQEVIDLLHARFDGTARQLITYYEPENSQIFVDHERLARLGLTLQDLARHLQARPFIFAAFTEDEVRRASGALAR
jgi:predicted AlkP superfamily pyrophosphatase or phosphodiesterase